MKNEIPKNQGMPHNVIIEGREKISVSGVIDVESFDENEVLLETSHGPMTIIGEDMRVDKLSIETGDAVIEGHIICLEYSDRKSDRKSLWSKLF